MKDALKYLINKYNLENDNREIIDIPKIVRKELADWIHDLGVENGVEVGVADGGFSEILCKTNSQMKLIGVDPYLSYSGYDDYKKKSTFERLEKEARERLSKFPNYEFMKEMSMDAVKKFEDESQDFVYIDANHKYKYVLEDIIEWSKKVKSGGIVSGHDFVYIAGVDFGVKSAVLNYIRENKIKPLFVLGSDGKEQGVYRELHRSWMFVKN